MTIARAAAAMAAMLTTLPAAAAREAPLWEAGFGIAGLEFPDYRGSSHSRGWVLPAPYFIYRGDFIKSDREGMRGSFFRNRDVDVNLSVGASLPVASDSNPEREGMPDLKPSLEIGPAMDITLWRAADERLKLDLRLPLRAAFTVESSPRFAGTQFFPNVNLDVHEPLGFAGWKLGMLGGAVFNDGRYNGRFYEVKPEFATAARPAFAAPGGGFGGFEFIVALSKRYPSFWVGGFARYDTLKGAVFEDSPLVTSKHYVAGGIAITWIFKESTTRVPVNEFGEEVRR